MDDPFDKRPVVDLTQARLDASKLEAQLLLELQAARAAASDATKAARLAAERYVTARAAGRQAGKNITQQLEKLLGVRINPGLKA